jgi:hypothetical protein
MSASSSGERKRPGDVVGNEPDPNAASDGSKWQHRGMARVGLPQPKSTLGRAVMPVAGGLLFFAVMAGVLWFIASLVSGGKATLKVGKGVWDTLRYEPLAKDVDANGPRLYPSLIGADESYLYVAHVGSDPEKGWFAFRATQDGQPNKCTVVWKPVDKVFVDPCDGRTFPANGEGLQQFDAIPNLGNGRLVIDLLNPLPSPTTTSP